MQKALSQVLLVVLVGFGIFVCTVRNRNLVVSHNAQGVEGKIQ